MVSLLAMFLAVQTAPPRTEIPIASFRAPNLFFTCRAAGLPSVGIDYDEMHREMDFGRYDSPVTHFILADPVKSVTYEGDQSAGRWTIRAEGPARSAEGRVTEGTPARIVLVLTRNPGGGVSTADFTVEAGSFRQENTGCGPAPMRFRPGHGMPLRPSREQAQ